MISRQKRRQPTKNGKRGKKPKLTRPHMPDSVKLAAALLQGIVGPDGQVLHKGDGHWDHDPALELRQFDGKKYTPDANDPNFIRYMAKPGHDKKTHGPGGEKRITTKGGDNHTAKQLDRLRDANREHAKTMQAKGGTNKGHAQYLERMAKLGKPVPQRRFP